MPNVRVTVLRDLAVLLLATSAMLPAARPERYALVLSDQPAAAQVASRKDLPLSAGADRRAAILAAQGSLRSTLSARKVRVIGANQTLANVVFVEATPEQAAQLNNLPGVARVQREARLKRHLNGALDLMKVPAAWGAVNGEQNAGAGVKIGILDTGIDHTHAAFKDDGFNYPPGFPKCQESRGDCAYVNRKIIAARSYVQMLVGTDPEFSRPDDLSPRDRVGHGTAVAMAAAGIRNSGPAGTITGVAPRAWLGNYKVFGSPGVNGRYTYDSVLLQALEDALNDGMDIVNFSIGGPAVWGPRDSGSDCGNGGTEPCDWRADAIENAARLGLTVVVSAGNSGATAAAPGVSLNSVETPGTAPSAITVGASTNKHIWYQSVRVEGQGVPAEIQTINTLFGDGPKPNPTLTAPARAVSTLDNDGRACTALANGSLNGVIALIERGDCGLELKVQYAQKAGAVGVIIYQSSGIEGTFRMSGMEETAIPAAMIGNRAGVALKDFIGRSPGASVTMDARLREVTTQEFDTMAVTSSRGPALFRVNRPTAENGIKPEVVAVGTDLYMATQKYDPNGDMYDPAGYIAADGTSFATAIVSGVAAIVKQRNPTFRPADIKSAIVNTASDEIYDYDSTGRQFKVGVIEAGGGKLNAEAAVRTNLTSTPATIWFGVVGSTAVSRGITLRNSGTAPLAVRLSVRPYGTGTHRVTVAPATATIAAGGTLSANVDFPAGAAPAPGIYDGWIVVEGGAVPIRIPYTYLVGDGVPYAILPLEGDGFEGDVGQVVPLTFKVTDQYGVPVAGLATQFQSVTGGGSVEEEGKETDALGIGYADVILGGQHGEQEYYVRVGNTNDFGFYFTGRARLTPSIATGGIVNAASGRLDRGVAPGSYISIFGRGLAEVTKVFNTPYLPLSLTGVSVSFDVPAKNQSFPARLHFVSDGQINVQVPWELQGTNSALLKVSIGDSSSTLVTVPLLDHAPAAFEYTEASGRQLVAALDSNFALVGTSNPARKGQVIQIYANGLGPVANQPPSGEVTPAQPFASTRAMPTVTVGGRAAEVVFSGLAPLNVGLYQINARIAADTPSGLQAVVITSNGIASKAANVLVE